MLKKIIYKENLIPLMLKNKWLVIHIPKCILIMLFKQIEMLHETYTYMYMERIQDTV